MYSDPYERFVHKPVERKPAPSPVVSYAKVKRHPPSVYVEPPKRKPGQRGRRETWPRIAELYAQHPTKPLSFLARLVGLHHTSVYHALKTMGLYVRRTSDELVAKQLAFRNIPGYVSPKKQQRERTRALIAEGKHWLPVAKLDRDRVRAMRHMKAEGIPIASIARKFHVGYTTAKRAINRTTWKHVP